MTQQTNDFMLLPVSRRWLTELAEHQKRRAELSQVDNTDGAQDDTWDDLSHELVDLMERIDPDMAVPAVATLSGEMLVELADQFIRDLRAILTPDELELVVARNRAERDDSICHSHDFCDANDVMTSSWETVFGGIPAFVTQGPMSLHGELDMAAWNEAWRIAKGKEFRLP